MGIASKRRFLCIRCIERYPGAFAKLRCKRDFRQCTCGSRAHSLFSYEMSDTSLAPRPHNAYTSVPFSHRRLHKRRSNRHPPLHNLDHQLPRTDALRLARLRCKRHVHPLPHRTNSALQRLQSLPVDFRSRRELQPAGCERCREPVLPEMDPLWRRAEGGSPV